MIFGNCLTYVQIINDFFRDYCCIRQHLTDPRGLIVVSSRTTKHKKCPVFKRNCRYMAFQNYLRDDSDFPMNIWQDFLLGYLALNKFLKLKMIPHLYSFLCHEWVALKIEKILSPFYEKKISSRIFIIKKYLWISKCIWLEMKRTDWLSWTG